jgi:hypothetical protein
MAECFHQEYDHCKANHMHVHACEPLIESFVPRGPPHIQTTFGQENGTDGRTASSLPHSHEHRLSNQHWYDLIDETTSLEELDVYNEPHLPTRPGQDGVHENRDTCLHNNTRMLEPVLAIDAESTSKDFEACLERSHSLLRHDHGQGSNEEGRYNSFSDEERDSHTARKEMWHPSSLSSEHEGGRHKGQHEASVGHAQRDGQRKFRRCAGRRSFRRLSPDRERFGQNTGFVAASAMRAQEATTSRSTRDHRNDKLISMAPIIDSVPEADTNSIPWESFLGVPMDDMQCREYDEYDAYE